MKNLSRSAFIAIAASGLVLGLTSCGSSQTSQASQTSQPSGSASGGSAQSSSLVTAPTSAPQASGNFGSVVTLPSGVAFTLNKLAVFTPTKFSSGQIDGETFNSFEITVKNGSKAPLDLGTLILAVKTTADNLCVDIFDGQVGLQGAPSNLVAVGGTTTFKWATSCPGKAGDPLNITLTTDGTTNVDVKGKLI